MRFLCKVLDRFSRSLHDVGRPQRRFWGSNKPAAITSNGSRPGRNNSPLSGQGWASLVAAFASSCCRSSLEPEEFSACESESLLDGSGDPKLGTLEAPTKPPQKGRRLGNLKKLCAEIWFVTDRRRVGGCQPPDKLCSTPLAPW